MSIKRRACFIIAVFLTALVPLAVFANAALDPSEYNLVANDVLTWSSFVDAGNLAVNAVPNTDLVTFYSTNVPENFPGGQHLALCLKTYIPNGNLIAGQSYSLSFYYPSDQELIALGRTQSYIDSNWNRVVSCVVGLGTLEHDSSGDYFQMLETASVIITADNRAQYGGHTNYINFVMPDYSGKQLYFIVGMWRGGSASSNNPTMYFGRYYGLIDFQRKAELEEYNRIWYGNAEGDYTNPFTTENYDLGDASDTDELEDAFDDFEDGLDNLTAPFRIVGRLLNDIFGANAPFAVIGTIVFLVLIFAVVFRLFGVT